MGKLGLRAGAQGRWWRREGADPLAEPLGHTGPSLPCRLRLIPKPPPRGRKSLAKQSPRRRLPGGQGRAPTTAFPSPRLQVGVLRLLLPPRRQCCYGDHCYLATKLVLGTCCLSSCSGDRPVSSSPHISENTPVGDKPGRLGQQGTCRDPPGSSRIRSGTISHKALVVFKTGNNCIDLWNNKNNIVKTKNLNTEEKYPKKGKVHHGLILVVLPGQPFLPAVGRER